MNPAWATLKEIFIKMYYVICVFYCFGDAYIIWHDQKQGKMKQNAYLMFSNVKYSFQV